MPKRILIDAFYLSILIPKGLPESDCQAIRRQLRRKLLLADLRKAVSDVFQRETLLRKVHFTLSR